MPIGFHNNIQYAERNFGKRFLNKLAKKNIWFVESQTDPETGLATYLFEVDGVGKMLTFTQVSELVNKKD